MTFDDYLEYVTENDSFTIHESWAQGRTTFGGLSAALLAQRIRSNIDQERNLRAVNVNFSAPLSIESPVKIKLTKLAQGKSLSQVMAQAIQNETICTTVLATFGKDKSSHIIHNSDELTTENGRELQNFPYIEGVAPKFIQHINIQIERGDLPFSSSKERELSGWMKFKDGVTKWTDVHVLGLIDVWPPTLLQNYRKPGPSSTANWNVDFINSVSDLNLTEDASLYYESRLISAQNGYGQTEARISDKRGKLLAVSRQLVTSYE